MKPPEPITKDHDLSQFACTHADLTKWLQTKSWHNQANHGSKTYVVCADDSMSVIGYYALAAGSIQQEDAPGKIKRNMPSPIPVTVLGRLAVHSQWEGQGIGKGLLKDAVLRSVKTSELIGVKAMLCHAIDEKAKDFYVKHGFLQSPLNPLTVMLPLNQK